MTERRLDSQSPGLGEDSQSRRDCRSAARSGGALAATLLLATSGFAAEPENLAPQAQVSATSEYSADYAARFAIDGLVPEALSHQDTAQAWCINRKQAGDQGEFTLRPRSCPNAGRTTRSTWTTRRNPRPREPSRWPTVRSGSPWNHAASNRCG